MLQSTQQVQGGGGARFGGTARYQPAQKESDLGFYLVMLAMLFEFGRPQDLFPPLRVIPIPTLLDVSIFLAIFMSGKANFSNKQTKLWIVLLIVMALWVPFANNNYWALMTLKDMSLYFFFYLGIVAFINSTSRMHKLILMWLAVHTVLAINGLLHHGRGVGGWMGDENDFGMEMNVAIPVAFFMYQGAAGKNKPLYIGLLGLFVMALVSTGSRGGFLGLLAVGAYCWFYSPRKVMSLIVGVCLAGLVLIAAPQEYWERISTITDDSTMETGTAGQRMFTWGIGWDMFLANPILGVGQSNFPWTIGEYLGGRTWQTKSLSGRQAHSLYFSLLPELGLVGVMIFGSMVYFSYKDTRVKEILRRSPPGMAGAAAEVKDIQASRAILYGNAIFGGMIGYLVTSTFISTLYYPTFWIMMGLAVALRNTTQTYAAIQPEVIANHGALRVSPKLRPRPVR
ncbi:MAG: O-antigen ligase family protein [Pseudobdellovibrionaceae bacterium]|nr:O-antigen ligase family protein [Pseudobdellovibrionaceae bacterium]